MKTPANKVPRTGIRKSAACLAAACALSVPNLHAQTLVWDFDEVGSLPTAVDSSGNSYNGTSAGNVAGNGSSYSGFTSTGSYVTHNFGPPPYSPTLTPYDNNLYRQDVTFVANISNPGTNGVNLVARGGRPTGGGDNAWSLWLSDPDIDGNRTISVGMQSWNSQQVVQTSNPIAFDQSTTYQIAIAWDFTDFAWTYDFNIYLTPAGAGSVVNVFSAVTTLDGGMADLNVDSFTVGGVEAGFWGTASPAGFFGGNISDVQLYLGTELTPTQLDAFIPVPEPGTTVMLAVGGLVCLAVRLRQRTHFSVNA